MKDAISSSQSITFNSSPLSMLHITNRLGSSGQSVKIFFLSPEKTQFENVQSLFEKREILSPLMVYPFLRVPGKTDLPSGWKTTER